MATMTSVPYDEEKYRKGINPSVYDKMITDYTAQANKERATQIGDAQKAQQAALKQAYITRLQNQQRLNANLAQSGIRGGMTETSNLRLANQYGQARAAANSDYANSVNSINQSADRNIFDYALDTNARKEEYLQNTAQAKWQAAREDAANKYNADLEKEKFAYQKKQDAQTVQREEVNRQTEYWSNYYINKYSGYSSKQLKTAEKDIKAKLAKAKTAYAKIRWQQALAGIGARRGVIATSK